MPATSETVVLAQKNLSIRGERFRALGVGAGMSRFEMNGRGAHIVSTDPESPPSPKDSAALRLPIYHTIYLSDPLTWKEDRDNNNGMAPEGGSGTETGEGAVSQEEVKATPEVVAHAQAEQAKLDALTKQNAWIRTPYSTRKSVDRPRPYTQRGSGRR